jgi:putative (di)nucleoside polyphosphate hydrolase
MVDSDGYRPNVGIVLANNNGQLLWARRIGQDSWQFPQGGICADETPEEAMLRELHEELGLQAHQVEVMTCTQGWLHYRLPERMVRRHREPVCIGQKQKWFLLRMLATDRDVCFHRNDKPEFDHWRWVSYWYPLGQVVAFKREVYRRALLELAPRLHGRRSRS